MKGFTRTAVLAALSASTALANPASPVQKEARAAGSSAALPTVTVNGNAFYAGNDRFYIRGVDYQPGGSSPPQDPIADEAGCNRDVPEFKKLGINTVRVYAVDNTANHDACMNLLAQNGIYLALDVNSPNYSIDRANPGPSYNDVYLQNVFATIDAFVGYSNTLLFFSGNEVINSDNTTGAAPYVKAATRDMKQYIGSRGYRPVPVGYSAADVDSNRFEMAQFMNCGTNDERSDFFAFNDYSWCDPSDYITSGWADKVKLYTGYSIPLFLSEYGCNKKERQFQEVGSLYSTNMTPVYSGGLVFEYSEEGDNYGLVQINGDSVQELEDYGALQQAYQNTPNPQGNGNAQTNGPPSQCPPQSNTWDVKSDSLPAMPVPAQKFMSQGAGKGAGLSGPGSANAGTASSGTATAGSGQVTVTPPAGGAKGSGKSEATGVQLPPLFTAQGVFSVVAVLFSMGLGAVLL